MGPLLHCASPQQEEEGRRPQAKARVYSHSLRQPVCQAQSGFYARRALGSLLSVEVHCRGCKDTEPAWVSGVWLPGVAGHE